ncbi:cyclase family protein [Antrihabitans sp. NCIMB 15449]|uniref:Cyclase family protein n=1 Tax=Antrihabitans spumae TaxID=3373370 RepID=A0ABW7JHW3_9NOCA
MCSPAVMAHVHKQVTRRAAAMSRRALLGAVGSVAVGAVSMAAPAGAKELASGEVVDLTHILSTGFPVWPGDEPFAMSAVGSIDRGGFYINKLQFSEHIGTHIDAPAHKITGGLTTERIAAQDLVAPLVVVDIAARAAVDPDAVLTIADLEAWEAAHGRIPDRGFVAMYSGWEARLSDPRTFVNQDALGIPHAPGFAPEAATFLVEQRNVVGIGVDTLSIDRSSSTDYGTHVAVLGAGRYGVEALANLAAVPAAGATVVIGAPKHAGGSGGPCRALALLT